MKIIDMKEKDGVFVVDDEKDTQEQEEREETPRQQFNFQQAKQGAQQFRQLQKAQQVLVGVDLVMSLADQMLNRYNQFDKLMRKIK